MLRLDQVHVIRHKVLVEKESARQVAEELGVSRNTVRRYLSRPEPARTESAPRARPVFSEVGPKMAELLAGWRTETTAKQRVTGTRLHRALREAGLEVGVTLVRDYLREERRKRAEVYVPLIHRPGDEAQVDFFEVTVDVDADRRKAWLFVMRLMASGRDFAWLYERCDQLAFLDGHVRAFRHFGGVPRRSIYDNLSAAVARIAFPKRTLTQRFAALASHYLFEPCFARPGEGHDKGGVEGRGRGIRLQQLTPIPKGPSLAAISAGLLERLDAEPRWQEAFAQEQPLLRPLPSADFEARRIVPVRVQRTSTVRLEGAWYSVPSRWAGLQVTAFIGVDDVRLVRGDEAVGHRRQRFGSRSIRYRHYLAVLATKPQALRQVAPELIAELGEPFGRLWTLLAESHGELDAARIFAQVLMAVCEHGEDAVRDALATSLTADRTDLLALLTTADRRPRTNPVPDTLAHVTVEGARAADYDQILVPSHG